MHTGATPSAIPPYYNFGRFIAAPLSSRGPGRSPFKAEIAGSNPAGGTILRHSCGRAFDRFVAIRWRAEQGVYQAAHSEDEPRRYEDGPHARAADHGAE